MFIPDPISFSIPHPGSEFFPSRIPIKELKYFNPEKGFYDPVCSSLIRIPNPDPDFLPIPDPGAWIKGSKRHRIPDPQPGLRIRIRIQSGQWIRIQEGKNDPQKQNFFFKVHVF
jgi:hypothetical protein